MTWQTILVICVIVFLVADLLYMQRKLGTVPSKSMKLLIIGIIICGILVIATKTL
jgi:hypothetical protein